MHTCTTTRAIFRSYLDGKVESLEVFASGLNRFEGGRCICQQHGVVYLHANGRVWADNGTLAALDTDFGVPNGDFHGDVALLPLCSSRRIGSINRQHGNRQAITLAGHYLCGHLLDELRSLRGDRGREFNRAASLRRNFNLVEVSQSLVYGIKVLLDDILTFLAIAPSDFQFDGLDGFVPGQNAGNGEEASLHDRVYVNTHAGLFRYNVGINHVEL